MKSCYHKNETVVVVVVVIDDDGGGCGDVSGGDCVRRIPI